MRTRRLPTGGLAALAVVLAALAVVVVAGARRPNTIYKVTQVTVTVPVGHGQGARRPHHPPTRSAASTADDDAALPPSAHRTSAPPVTSTTSPPTPAATTSSSSTTTTVVAVTTTTAVRPTTPTSRRGWFAGGTTSETEWLGDVRSVTVDVPAGIRVTLTVTCGFVRTSKTAFHAVTVRGLDGGASCVATFSVPPTSPQPAPWRLVTA